MTFAERLKELRTEKKLSMDDVGNYIGVGRANIYKYEHGIVVNIPTDRLNKLAHLFGVSRSYLMGWTNDRHTNVPEEGDYAAVRSHSQKEVTVLNAITRCTCKPSVCEGCPYNGQDECIDKLLLDALSIINVSSAVQPKKYPPSRYSATTFGCRAFGHELAPGNPKFCSECGRPIRWD